MAGSPISEHLSPYLQAKLLRQTDSLSVSSSFLQYSPVNQLLSRCHWTLTSCANMPA